MCDVRQLCTCKHKPCKLQNRVDSSGLVETRKLPWEQNSFSDPIMAGSVLSTTVLGR